jgi:hypothetical protein
MLTFLLIENEIRREYKTVEQIHYFNHYFSKNKTFHCAIGDGKWNVLNNFYVYNGSFPHIK